MAISQAVTTNHPKTSVQPTVKRRLY